MIRFGTTFSRLFIILSIGVTLFLRFYLEPQLQGNMIISIGLGAFALIFLYALIKSGLLNPGWFRFEKDYANKEAS